MSYSVCRSMTVWIKENLFSKIEGSNRTFRTELKLPTILKRNLFGFTYWLLGACLVAQLVESACSAGDLASITGSGRFPWRRKQQPTPVSLSGEFPRQWSLVGYSSWGHKESDMSEWLTLLFSKIKNININNI